MVQILLSLIVLIAGLVLLVNSWKAEKRLFAATALVVVLTAGVISGVLVYQTLQPPALLDPSQISITLDSARVGENGVRIAGQLHNRSTERVASVRLRVTALICEADKCTDVGHKQVDVLIQIPPDTSYPFSTVAPVSGLPKNTELSWRVEPVKVTVF
jgi:hypothetical protein